MLINCRKRKLNGVCHVKEGERWLQFRLFVICFILGTGTSLKNNYDKRTKWFTTNLRGASYNLRDNSSSCPLFEVARLNTFLTLRNKRAVSLSLKWIQQNNKWIWRGRFVTDRVFVT